MDEKCITLAELAATAVDFPKTGQQLCRHASMRKRVTNPTSRLRFWEDFIARLRMLMIKMLLLHLQS
jgi:hypothetical protein